MVPAIDARILIQKRDLWKDEFFRSLERPSWIGFGLTGWASHALTRTDNACQLKRLFGWAGLFHVERWRGKSWKIPNLVREDLSWNR